MQYSTQITKMIATTAIAGALLFTAACSGNTDTTPDNSTSATSSTQGTQAESDSSAAGSVINGLPTKEELGKDSKGEYIQTTITTDDKAMKYDPATADEEAKKSFTAEEIQQAQEFVMTFTAEEFLDSRLNRDNSPELVQAWKKDNIDKFAKSTRDEVLLDLNEREQPLLIQGYWRDGNYDLVSGADKTRIISREIGTPEIYGGDAKELKGLGFYFPFEVTYSVIKDGKEQEEVVAGEVSYTLLKESDGFKIAGYQTEFSTERL